MFNFPFQTEALTFDEWNLAAYRKLSAFWMGFTVADNGGDLPTDYQHLNGFIWSVFSVIDEEFDEEFDDDVLMHTGELNTVRYDSCNYVVMSGLAKRQFIEKYGHRCPVGVNGRNSDNTLYREKIGWEVSQPLKKGMKITYNWIEEQVRRKNG